MAAFGDAGQHRWWWLSVGTVLPAFWLTRLVPALHGWPLNVTTWVWLLVIAVLYVDVIISYRRRRRAARRDMYARLATALTSYEATKRPDLN